MHANYVTIFKFDRCNHEDGCTFINNFANYVWCNNMLYLWTVIILSKCCYNIESTPNEHIMFPSTLIPHDIYQTYQVLNSPLFLLLYLFYLFSRTQWPSTRNKSAKWASHIHTRSWSRAFGTASRANLCWIRAWTWALPNQMWAAIWCPGFEPTYGEVVRGLNKSIQSYIDL